MAAPDIKAVAAALATGYASLTPPTGYPAIRRSTEMRPNAIPTFPMVTVSWDDGVQSMPPTVFELLFKVRLWFGKHTGDQARDDALVLAWLGVILVANFTTVNAAAIAAGNQVKSALGGEIRYFVDDYASTLDCFGIESDVTVVIRDWPLT